MRWLACDAKRFAPARRAAAIFSVIGLGVGHATAQNQTNNAETTPSAMKAPPEPTIEVIVQETRKPRDGSSLTRSESREVPGAFGDPFRTVETMPGVSGIVSGLPYFFIRGAPPGNVGYFLDDIRVPMLYHAFAGPSVIHPAFIDSVELHRGGYPARFGRFAGGIVEGRTALPANELKGEAAVRLFDAGAMVATPFANGRGNVTVGGRYSYTGLLVSMLSNVKLEYWDYQAMASYELGPKDCLRILTFGASDYSATNNDGVISSVEFHRASLRSMHDFDSDTQLVLSITTGWDRTRTQDDRYQYITRTANGWAGTGGMGIFLRDTMLQGRANLSHRMGSRASVNVGVDAAIDRFQLDLPNSEHLDWGRVLGALYPTRNDFAAGVFIESQWSPTKRLRLMPGLRADLYRSLANQATAVEPRIVATVDVTPRVRLLHAFGLAHQPPNATPPGLPGIQQMAGLPRGLQRSYQASSGIEWQLPSDFTATATLFDNVFTNLSDPAGTTGAFGAETVDLRGIGSAIGLELSLHRPITRRVGGFINYTLSRSTRSQGRITAPSAFDHTHVANLVLAYDLGARWRVGARLFYQSGVPVRVPTTDGPRYDSERRAPGFARLDLRLEKRWKLGARGQISAVAEILNATMSREILRRNCNASGCRDDSFGPFFLPSIGVEARY